MTFEYTEDMARRAETALVPFVRAFNLPVNPEDLGLMAYAVLRYTHSGEPLPQVAAEVQDLIDQHFADHQRMLDAMDAYHRTTQPGSTGTAG